jgi:hemerythrin superfamily protein
MDVIDFIKQDHQRIEDLFNKFLASEVEAQQEDLYQEIQTGLNAHSEMEERVLYPALKQFAPEQVDEALEEHGEVKEILAELLDADLNGEEFDVRFNELMSDVIHHVEEEESPQGLLEVARRNFDQKRLAQMVREMQDIKREVQEDLAA